MGNWIRTACRSISMRSFRFRGASCAKASAKPGRSGCWANWGVLWPIRRVSFAIERERKSGIKGGGIEPVAVFRFLCEDWSPLIALLRMRKRWPELRFEMKAEYLEMAVRGQERKAEL